MATCPYCNLKLPIIRIPTNWSQMMWGGWTCPRCGCEIGRNGRLIKQGEEKIMKQYKDNLYKEEYIKEKARLQAQKEFKQDRHSKAK